MANQQKQSIVDGLTKSLEESKNFAIIKFEKTSHTNLETLRRELSKADASIKVVKNTLFEKVINRLSQSEKSFEELRAKAFPIKENSAVLFLKGDFSAGLKAFYEFAKKETSVAFKFGHLDHAFYSGNDVKRIAQLPGKDQLVAKVIGSFKSPMARTTRAMQFNMQKFVYILSQKSKQA